MIGAAQAPLTRIPYKPRAHAVAFHARHHKAAVVVWHRRAGKTVMCIADLIEKAMHCPLEMPQYGYIAPTYRQAKKIAWKYLKKMSKPVCEKVMESELSVELVNGATITLFGADNPDSLRGMYFDGLVIDEYGDVAPYLFGEIVGPALADRDGWVVFIGTPKGPNHFHELWNAALEEADWFTSMLKASESGVFTKERLAKIKKQPGSDEDTYQQEYECDFNAANKGSYYGKLVADLEAAGHMGLFPFDPEFPVITGWDLGYTDDTSIWFVQKAPDGIRVVDFYTVSGQSIDEIVADLRKKPYIYGDFYLPHDAKAKSLQTGKSIREQLWEHGINSTIVPKLSVQDGIQAVRVTLPTMYFNIGNEDVRKVGINALKMYKREYDDKRQVFRQVPLHDWSSNPCDALRYLCLGLNPFTEKKAAEPIRTALPSSSKPRELNLQNLFADRAARKQSSRI